VDWPLISVFLGAASVFAQTAAVDIPLLEKRADAEFNRRDCPAAEKTYAELLAAAQAAGETRRTGSYYLRIGNCRTRVGDFASSLDAYRKGMAAGEASGDEETLRGNLHGAALQLMKLGRVDESLPLGQREYELARKLNRPTALARAMWLQSAQYRALGRIRDEVRLLTDALAISRTTTDSATTAVILQGLAIEYLALGDAQTAEHFQMEIIAMPDAQRISMSTTTSAAGIYENLAEIQLKAGHPVEARKSLERAVESSTGPDDYRVHIDALLNLAATQNSAGQIAQSDRGFREALDRAQSVRFPDLESGAWQMYSDALLSRGDRAGALEAAGKALQLAQQSTLPDRLFNARFSLGSAQAAGGDRAKAKASFQEALQLGETQRAQSPGEFSDLTRAFERLLPVYQASVRNLIEMHLPSEALEQAEQAKARVLMDILLRGGINERDAATKSEMAEQDRLRQRVAAGSAEAIVELRQFRRKLYQSHPDLAVQSADFEPARVKQLAALMAQGNTALLDYFAVQDGVALFVVRQPGTGAPKVSAWFLPDPKHTLAGEARSFRQRLATRDLDYRNAARHLYDRLLAPAAAELSGSSDWIVSPDGALWEIPFEALIDTAGKHVIETRSIALAPSLTAARYIHERKRPAGQAGVRLLAFGNPLPASVPLPDAIREVTDIGANYPKGSAVVLTGTAASRSALLEKGPAAGIIHFAAHAGLNDRDPLSSFVSLSNGQSINAQTMMSLRLRADMVVVSACETALGSTAGGEGLIGMGWALAASGAASSVLSLWKVDSAASRDFMTAFYRSHGMAKSEALRRAGLQMLQSPQYRHPFYWAAFTLQGDGSSPLFE
jgi:CHAT domain-containing protein